MDKTVQPLATIPGGSCLKEYRILPNKREILTRDSAGNVALWSVLFVSGCGVLVEVGVSLMLCGCGGVGVVEWKGGEGKGREEDLVTDVFV